VQRLGGSDSAASETERLFDECRDSLIRYLRYHLDDRSEAEDIAQESFVRFFQARKRQESIAQPKAWLFRVAHNLLIDLGRKHRPELLDEQEWTIHDRGVDPGRRTEARIEVSKLCWERLTPSELDCLRLRTEGLKYREIGEILDLSISTVVSYISRALAKLREGVEEKSDASKHGRTAAAL
jgi:RNA polymerase sigma-70 factor (ECF subfamily)